MIEMIELIEMIEMIEMIVIGMITETNLEKQDIKVGGM